MTNTTLSEGLRDVACIDYEGQKVCNRAADVLEALEWRDIGGALKDGTKYLGFARDACGIEYFGVIQWAEADLDFPRTVEGWFWSFAIRPTHFMPLPQAPEVEG